MSKHYFMVQAIGTDFSSTHSIPSPKRAKIRPGAFKNKIKSFKINDTHNHFLYLCVFVFCFVFFVIFAAPPNYLTIKYLQALMETFLGANGDINGYQWRHKWVLIET